jgi:hypothetical protein
MITADGKEIVSRGRWKDWWDSAHPHPSSVDLINQLIPNSKNWFFSGLSDHPVQNFLYGLDLIASKTADTNQAMQALLQINEAWRPTVIKQGSATAARYLGWKIPKLSEQVIPPEWIERYSPLRPASIIEFMLWTGYHLQVQGTSYFMGWIFDLLTAALAVKTIINSTEYPVDHFNDQAIDIAAMLLDSFIQYHHSLVESEDPKEWITMRCGGFKIHLPPEARFYELLTSAVTAFNSELSRYDITPKEIKSLLPRGR